MKKVGCRRYYVGYYGYAFKEVSREIFLKCLKDVTKSEYEMLINGRMIWRGNIKFSILDDYKMVEDEFDLMRYKVWDTFKNYFYMQRATKIINGIKCGKINKENLCEEILNFTKRVKSKRSLEAWNNLTDWFLNIEW